MSKSAERGGLHKHRRLGSGAPERKGPVSPVNGHRQRGAARPISAKGGSHAFIRLVTTADHMVVNVIRAARLAATLLRIAQDLRHAEKGSARL